MLIIVVDRSLIFFSLSYDCGATSCLTVTV